jgi:uncharacterized protein YwgA
MEIRFKMKKKIDNLIYVLTPNITMQAGCPELIADEWVLVFLMANQRSSIHGKLMFAKEIFIASNEIEQVSENLKKTFKFYPSHYGPYSDAFEDAITKLKASGEIITEEETFDNKTRIIFKVTEKGMNRIKDIYERLPEIARKRISKLKEGADQLGYMGILKHVYTHYPEYAIKSKIKGEIYDF